MTIDREIRSGRFPSAPGLARMLEVSLRTVQRDLEFLRDQLRAPLEWNAQQGGYAYTEPSGFFLPVQQLTEGELLAVLVADKALNEYRGTSFEGRLKSIFDKLTEVLPEEVTISPQELAHAYSFQWTAPVRTDGAIFRALQQAIHDGETLEILYHPQSRDVTGRRQCDPYHLATVDGEWYLLAFCHTHQEIRIFRPSRIREIRRTGNRFQVPSSFDPARFLKTKFQAMSGESPVEIRIRFDPTLAGYIKEREWSPAHRLQFTTDGGVDLTLTTENVDAVVRWVLNWGPGAEIVAPPWVRRRVRDTLKRLAERYAARPEKPRNLSRLGRGPRKIFKPPSPAAGSGRKKDGSGGS